MHQASFDEMEKFRKTYLADRTGLTVLDVGSYRSRPKPGAIRHSYRPIFEKVGHRYVGMDIRPGRNVDIVPVDIYMKGWDTVGIGRH